ncbi:MAG: glutamine-hydrolyzing carbamoyl-phosphate synthase small subunit, partial [Thiohalomonadales bacterium]
MLSNSALLALADGSLFRGTSIGVDGHREGEVVFNTALTGYQEILTDPSYCQQIVTLTYPHIGNVGCNPDDDESDQVHASGLVIRELSLIPSSWRSEQSLPDYLQQHAVVAIADIDTRRLTRILRDKGALAGCIIAGKDINDDTAIELARAFPGLEGQDLAKVVSTKKQYTWDKPSWRLPSSQMPLADRDVDPFHVVVYDFGVKRNILRLLVDRGCRVTIVPAQTAASDVIKLKPHGIFLSNGPGDPEPCDYALVAIREILAADIPVFGICLGHQLLALASGAKTQKMKFGHHGANHPVQKLDTGEVMITSQNHGFSVDEESLPADLVATHRSLFDGTLQGIRHKTRPALS